MATDNLVLLSPFDRSRRPAKIADAMWEVVGTYRQPEVAFHPIIDFMIMLLARPVAISFFRKEGPHVYRYLMSTMPSDDAESSFGVPGGLAPENVIERTHLLHVPPATAEGESTLYAALSEVRSASPLPPSKSAPSGPRKQFELHQYTPTQVDIDHIGPKGGPDFDIWCLERLFAELRKGVASNHKASSQVLAALHTGADKKFGIAADEGDVGEVGWPAGSKKAWDNEREIIVERYWRPMLAGIFPEVTGETPRERLLSSLEFALAFRCALPDGAKRAGIYDYTAQMVLSSEQLSAARRFLVRPDFRASLLHPGEKWNLLRRFANSREVLEALERPLDISFRAIADTPFMSGFADVAPDLISDHIRNGPAVQTLSEEEIKEYEARKDAEWLVLDEQGNRSLYVPIHISGVPFLSILILHRETVAPVVRDDIWERWYRAYRGQIQIMAARLRAAARQAYSQALADILREELVGGDRRDWKESINQRWRQLSAFFPYDLVQLVGVRRGRAATKEELELPWNELADIVLAPNPHLCFRRDKLDHDRIDLAALRDHLVSVAKAAAAERLDALALQDAAFAHDVKHWTAPMREDMSAATRADDRDTVRRHLKRASLHLDLLNACADARQQAVRNRQDPRADVFSEWMLKDRDKQVLAIKGALELLLHLHAETIRTRSSDVVQLQLQWRKNWEDVDEIFEALEGLVPRERRRVSGARLLARPEILWPLGVLREVVHNMRILRPIPDLKFSNIEISYEVTKNEDAWGGIEVAVRQRSHDQQKLPDNKELKRGIALANTLYGARGAGKGAISDPQFQQTPFSATLDNGAVVEAYKIDYDLSVLFFE